MKKIILLISMITILGASFLNAQNPTPTPSNADEQLKMSLANAITELNNFTTSTSSFVKEQAPDIAKQYLEWEAYHSKWWMIFQFVFSGVFLILGGSMIIAAFKDDDDFIGPGICCFAIMILFLCFAGSNYLEIQKIKTAPKVYLLDYAKSLTK